MSSYEQRQPAAPVQQEQVDSGPSRSAAIVKKLLPLIIVAVLLIIFITQNDGETTVKFLSWERELRVAWALLIAAVAGAVIGWLTMAFWRHRRNNR